MLLTVEYLVNGKFLNVALENSDLVDFQMSNLYLKWANQAMSDGWEVVTFARHKDHVPIVRGHLGSLRSMISAIISGDLQKGVDFECFAFVVGQLDTDAVILAFHDWESVIGFEEVSLQAW